MNPLDPDPEAAAPGPAKGIWRPLLRARLAGRAEPLFITASGMRSAASLWSGAQAWAQLLRGQPDSQPVVVRQIERLALLQLLVAVLWDGRTLQLEAASQIPRTGPVPGAWCLDGRQVLHDGQAVCSLGDGGWPDLAGPARMSTLEMLAGVPAHGALIVQGRQASHGELWLALGAPLGQPAAARPGAGVPVPETRSEVLPPFHLAGLATPHDVLNDALLPLLHCTELWDHAAQPAA